MRPWRLQLRMAAAAEVMVATSKAVPGSGRPRSWTHHQGTGCSGRCHGRDSRGAAMATQALATTTTNCCDLGRVIGIQGSRMGRDSQGHGCGGKDLGMGRGSRGCDRANSNCASGHGDRGRFHSCQGCKRGGDRDGGPRGARLWHQRPRS